MAIDIDNNKLGSINPQIDTNVDLKPGAQILEAQRELYGKVQSVSQGIYDKYAPIAGKKAAMDKFVDNLDKGEAGDYSHISQFTPYGEAYNKVMDKLAPMVLSSNGEALINEFSKNILNDTSIPYSEKVQEFASKSKQTISDYLKNIPDEHRASVALMLNRQASDSQNNIISHVATVQASQQQYSALESINQISKLADSATNINQSFQYYQQVKSSAEASLALGVTPERVENIIKNAGSQIFGRWNNQEITAFNESLPEADKLSSEQIEGASNYYTKQYNVEQTAIKQYELQHQYSQEKHIVELSHGINNPAPYPQTDIEIAENQAASSRYRLSFLDSPAEIKQEDDARNAGNFANTFKSFLPMQNYMLSTGDLDGLKKSMPEEQYNNFESQIQSFLRAPVRVQNSTMSYLRQYENDIKYDPVKNMGLEGKSPAIIYQSQLERGLTPVMMSKAKLAEYALRYTQDPIGAVNGLNNDYGMYSSLASKQLAKQTGDLGVTISDPNVRNEYLLSKSLNIQPGRFNISKIKADVSATLSTLPDNTKTWINQVIPALSKTRQESPNDILNDLFVLRDGNFVYKNDEHILSSSYREQLGKYIGSQNSDKILPQSTIQLDPINNVYNIYGSNKELYYTVTKEEVDNLHSKSLIDNLKDKLFNNFNIGRSN